MAGINYYVKYPSLKQLEDTQKKDLSNLYYELGYYTKNQMGADVLDNNKFYTDYWDSTKQQDINGLFQRQNKILNQYYTDLAGLGISGVDGKPITLESNNLPIFSGSWYQSDANKTMSFGTPDKNSMSWMGPMTVMGQEHEWQPLGLLTRGAPEAPLFNEMPTFTSGQGLLNSLPINRMSNPTGTTPVANTTNNTNANVFGISHPDEAPLNTPANGYLRTPLNRPSNKGITTKPRSSLLLG